MFNYENLITGKKPKQSILIRFFKVKRSIRIMAIFKKYIIFISITSLYRHLNYIYLYSIF